MGRKILSAFLIILAFGCPAWAGELRVYFLDAGEGEAIYLESAGKGLLVDAGNPITGGRAAEFLQKKGIKHIDALIVTHPHLDHSGGVLHILNRFEVGARYDNGEPVDKGKDIHGWYAEVFRQGNYKALKTGDAIEAGDALITVLWPPSLDSDWNNNSLVLRVVHGDNVFLLMGDAGHYAEERLIESGKPLKSNVLKVGHHGASDATSAGFLNAVSPRYAVVSINEKNTRGYPSDKVISRLKEKGVEVFLTYRDGNVLFISNGLEIIRPKREKR